MVASRGLVMVASRKAIVFDGSKNFRSSKFRFRVGLKLETRCLIPL